MQQGDGGYAPLLVFIRAGWYVLYVHLSYPTGTGRPLDVYTSTQYISSVYRKPGSEREVVHRRKSYGCARWLPPSSNPLSFPVDHQ